MISRPLSPWSVSNLTAKLRELAVREVFRGMLSRFCLLACLCVLMPASPLAAAETQNERFQCRVELFGPRLDFELRFFTGFRIYAPTEPLEGPSRFFVLRVLVTPLDVPGAEPSMFERTFQAGPIPAVRRKEIQISDSFATGPGRYKVAWALIDTRGPSCVVEREIKAELRKKDSGTKLSVAPGEVINSRIRMFRSEKAVVGESAKPPLRVKVFLDLDVPQGRGRTRVRLWELMPRIAALRALSRHPRIGGLSLVAYSVEEQAVIARHLIRDEFDYGSLRRNIDELQPGFVSIDQLQKDSDLAFFNEMLLRELPGDEPVDAYVFLGPDVIIRKNREKERLESIGPIPTPMFSLVNGLSSWKGLVGKTVGFFGGRTLRFYNPIQMSEGVEKLVADLDAAE
jgi:hypothetical protein